MLRGIIRLVNRKNGRKKVVVDLHPAIYSCLGPIRLAELLEDLSKHYGGCAVEIHSKF